jgi:hypothetical protein
VRIPGGRSPLGKPRHRLMNYIKICLKERGWDDVELACVCISIDVSCSLLWTSQWSITLSELSWLAVELSVLWELCSVLLVTWFISQWVNVKLLKNMHMCTHVPSCTCVN